jgi:hypothetical protein
VVLERKFEGNFTNKNSQNGVLMIKKITFNSLKLPTTAAKEPFSEIDIVKIICNIHHKIVTNLKLSFHDQKHDRKLREFYNNENDDFLTKSTL